MAINDMSVRVFKALAHPIRLKIVQALKDGPLCVCVLNENVEFSQSNLSQHLKILKDAGIVESERDGLRVLYRIRNKEVTNLLAVAERIVKSEIQSLVENLDQESR